MSRDCLFFVADGTMAEVIDGFLSRGHFPGRLGCRDFEFSFDDDILVGTHFGATDGGMHKYCHALLQENGYMESHQHLVVMLDQKFGGERPAAEVREEVLANLQQCGWADRADVVVIDPELEVWVWQDNPHVERAVGYSGRTKLRELLNNDDEWPGGRDKPIQPKDLFKAVCKRFKQSYSPSLYRDIVEKVSIAGCTDQAFHQLVASLVRWFPIGEAQ
jgi:hypothetical protein